MTDADHLNFKPPQPPSFAQPIPATTDIVCYFNPNQWPVMVSNNALGISMVLSGRGDQLLSVDTGEPVNDPRLMCFVSPGQLSCKRGTEQIPVVTYRRSTAQAVPSASNFPHGFAASVTSMPNGRTTIPAAVPPPVNSNSMTAFPDRASAIKAGLIDGKIVDLQEGVPDTEGQPPQSVPELRVPNYRPVNVDMAKFAAAQAENAAQQTLVNGLVNAATAPEQDAIKQAISSVVPASVVVATPPPSIVPPSSTVPPPTVVPNTYPVPSVEESADIPPAKVSTPATKEFPYKDPKSGRSFEFRSLLERHLKANYKTEEVEQIMTQYPRVNNRGLRKPV